MTLPPWSVKRRATSRVTRSFSDGALRQAIRKCSLSGLELVKAPVGDDWVPLHTLPVFREEATGGRAASDPALLAGNRSAAMTRFIAVMGIAGGMGVATAIAAASGSPESAAFLGAISMLMLGVGWATGMLTAIKYGGRSSARSASASTATPVPALDDLELALAGLERSLLDAPASVAGLVSMRAIREGVVATRRKRVLLRSMQGPEDPRPALLTELVTAKECAAKATDAGSADAFADEVRSIEGLLESLDLGMKAASEAEARERALVNEIEALSLSVVRATVSGSPENEMVDRLASLRRQLEEESAIEATLTRGVRKMGPVSS